MGHSLKSWTQWSLWVSSNAEYSVILLLEKGSVFIWQHEQDGCPIFATLTMFLCVWWFPGILHPGIVKPILTTGKPLSDVFHPLAQLTTVLGRRTPQLLLQSGCWRSHLHQKTKRATTAQDAIAALHHFCSKYQHRLLSPSCLWHLGVCHLAGSVPIKHMPYWYQVVHVFYPECHVVLSLAIIYYIYTVTFTS